MKQRLPCFIVGLAIAALVLPAPGFAEDGAYRTQSLNQASNPIAASIRLYQAYVSPVNGQRCPMSPSCSSYSLQAFEKHGPLMGWVMTCDRLLRCGRDEARLAEVRRIRQETYSHDPLHNNDFWWSGRK